MRAGWKQAQPEFTEPIMAVGQAVKVLQSKGEATPLFFQEESMHTDYRLLTRIENTLGTYAQWNLPPSFTDQQTEVSADEHVPLRAREPG
jgi:hypothetical protein